MRFGQPLRLNQGVPKTLNPIQTEDMRRDSLQEHLKPSISEKHPHPNLQFQFAERTASLWRCADNDRPQIGFVRHGEL